LQITREATKADIKRAFRAVASKTHPDKFQDPSEKRNAEIRFKKLATAYDILRDDEFRQDYDYMLDHPDEFYMNFYRAWRRRNYPNVDVRIVLAVTISLISDKKKQRRMTKQQIKEEEEQIIRKVIEDKMDIRGVYAKPTIYDLLWVQMVMLPIWTFQYLAWYCSWIYRIWILKRDYEKEDKNYLIRKKMCMSQGQYDALDDETREKYLKLELWKQENFQVWKAERDEEIRIKQASSGRFKSYRRYLKNNGPGRMYFDD
ncbi:hypothetical protein HAZT_HAZT005755, partial [Hyalella azteca]